MSEKFTCVFDFDIRGYKPNPFHADTPFGRPELISRGDLAEKLAEAEEEIESLKSELADLYAGRAAVIPQTEEHANPPTQRGQLEMFNEDVVPVLFLITFAILFVGSNLSTRFAVIAIPLFGFGWLFAIVWWGMLRRG